MQSGISPAGMNSSLEAAKAFAEKEGIAYRVQVKREAKRRRTMTYSENFSFNRSIPWTWASLISVSQ